MGKKPQVTKPGLHGQDISRFFDRRATQATAAQRSSHTRPVLTAAALAKAASSSAVTDSTSSKVTGAAATSSSTATGSKAAHRAKAAAASTAQAAARNALTAAAVPAATKVPSPSAALAGAAKPASKAASGHNGSSIRAPSVKKNITKHVAAGRQKYKGSQKFQEGKTNGISKQSSSTAQHTATAVQGPAKNQTALPAPDSRTIVTTTLAAGASRTGAAPPLLASARAPQFRSDHLAKVVTCPAIGHLPAEAAPANGAAVQHNAATTAAVPPAAGRPASRLATEGLAKAKQGMTANICDGAAVDSGSDDTCVIAGKAAADKAGTDCSAVGTMPLAGPPSRFNSYMGMQRESHLLMSQVEDENMQVMWEPSPPKTALLRHTTDQEQVIIHAATTGAVVKQGVASRKIKTATAATATQAGNTKDNSSNNKGSATAATPGSEPVDPERKVDSRQPKPSERGSSKQGMSSSKDGVSQAAAPSQQQQQKLGVAGGTGDNHHSLTGSMPSRHKLLSSGAAAAASGSNAVLEEVLGTLSTPPVCGALRTPGGPKLRAFRQHSVLPPSSAGGSSGRKRVLDTPSVGNSAEGGGNSSRLTAAAAAKAAGVGSAGPTPQGCSSTFKRHRAGLKRRVLLDMLENIEDLVKRRKSIAGEDEQGPEVGLEGFDSLQNLTEPDEVLCIKPDGVLNNHQAAAGAAYAGTGSPCPQQQKQQQQSHTHCLPTQCTSKPASLCKAALKRQQYLQQLQSQQQQQCHQQQPLQVLQQQHKGQRDQSSSSHQLQADGCTQLAGDDEQQQQQQGQQGKQAAAFAVLLGAADAAGKGAHCGDCIPPSPLAAANHVANAQPAATAAACAGAASTAHVVSGGCCPASGAAAMSAEAATAATAAAVAATAAAAKAGAVALPATEEAGAAAACHGSCPAPTVGPAALSLGMAGATSNGGKGGNSRPSAYGAAHPTGTIVVLVDAPAAVGGGACSAASASAPAAISNAAAPTAGNAAPAITATEQCPAFEQQFAADQNTVAAASFEPPAAEQCFVVSEQPVGSQWAQALAGTAVGEQCPAIQHPFSSQQARASAAAKEFEDFELLYGDIDFNITSAKDCKGNQIACDQQAAHGQEQQQQQHQQRHNTPVKAPQVCTVDQVTSAQCMQHYAVQQADKEAQATEAGANYQQSAAGGIKATAATSASGAQNVALIGGRADVFHTVLKVQQEPAGLILHCLNPYKGTEVFVHLSHPWCDAPVAVGDSANIIGGVTSKDEQGRACVYISHEQGLFILHPDVLLSGTTITTALTCPRRAWLTERIAAAGGGPSAAALLGTLLHELLQKLLVQCMADEAAEGAAVAHGLEQLQATVHAVLSSAGERLQEVGLTEEAAAKEMDKHLPNIAAWVRQYLPQQQQQQQQQQVSWQQQQQQQQQSGQLQQTSGSGQPALWLQQQHQQQQQAWPQQQQWQHQYQQHTWQQEKQQQGNWQQQRQQGARQPHQQQGMWQQEQQQQQQRQQWQQHQRPWQQQQHPAFWDPVGGKVHVGPNSSFKEPPRVIIQGVADIEENIWAPRYGLKGQLDASLLIKLTTGMPAAAAGAKESASGSGYASGSEYDNGSGCRGVYQGSGSSMTRNATGYGRNEAIGSGWSTCTAGRGGGRSSRHGHGSGRNLGLNLGLNIGNNSSIGSATQAAHAAAAAVSAGGDQGMAGVGTSNGGVRDTTPTAAQEPVRFTGRLSGAAAAMRAVQNSQAAAAAAGTGAAGHHWQQQPCQQQQWQPQQQPAGATSELVMMPFEFKTGKDYFSHRAQVSLYLLLMESRYQLGLPLAGLLWNVNSPTMSLVPARHDELAPLLSCRNRLASHLWQDVSPPPRMLGDPHTCSRCHSAQLCGTVHAVLENGTAASSGMDDVQWQVSGGRVSAAAAAWGSKWLQLIDWETSAGRARRKEVWTITGAQRQAKGGCIAGLHLMRTDTPQDQQGTNEQLHLYTFKQLSSRIHGSSGNQSQQRGCKRTRSQDPITDPIAGNNNACAAAPAATTAAADVQQGVAAATSATTAASGVVQGVTTAQGMAITSADSKIKNCYCSSDSNGTNCSSDCAANLQGILASPGDCLLLGADAIQANIGRVNVVQIQGITITVASRKNLQLERYEAAGAAATAAAANGPEAAAGQGQTIVWRLDQDDAASTAMLQRASILQVAGASDSNGCSSPIIADKLRQLLVDLVPPKRLQITQQLSHSAAEPAGDSAGVQAAKAAETEAGSKSTTSQAQAAAEAAQAGAPAAAGGVGEPCKCPASITVAEAAATAGADPGLAAAAGGSTARLALAAGRAYLERQGLQLNSDQLEVLQRVLQLQDYCLVLGMPGTGKTSTIAHAIHALVASGASVLVTSYTNSALDNILLKLVADDGREQDNGSNQGFKGLLRLGRSSSCHPELRQYMPGGARYPQRSTADLLQLAAFTPVVGCPCLSTHHPLLAARPAFDVVIVDEAGQITLPAVLGALLKARSFVLVGDHYQLPPLVLDPRAAAGGLSISLFRQLCEAHPATVVALRRQYRMCEEIMGLANELVYAGQLLAGNQQAAAAALQLPMPEALQQHPAWVIDLLNPSRKVAFANTDTLLPEAPATEDAGSGSGSSSNGVLNRGEAALLLMCLRALLECGVPGSDIGVVSPYKAQVNLLQQLVAVEPHPAAQEVECLTIDRCQGRDKAIVLLSFVRSNTRGAVGNLLKDWQRLNVAITRAKVKLLMVGSAKTLGGGKVQMLDTLLRWAEQKGCMVTLPPNAVVQQQ